ncbi:Arc-like DNA binding dprotein [Phyllobacterium myrsinacearum]|uniref:Arc family DNA-binding protein n=1 Tax=Phyllobacterium myrsinacearum TaxID=28101 RepID=UPI0010E22B51|nr:Arc family DNA-binding protein [Phyllobacterium myrsinacearum]RZS82070.1 Arc-like DNA binding dprotein [Phyllobacterium myrsinacearum]
MAADIDEVRMTLRLPAGVRDRLLEKGKENGRSINAEIIARLERTISEEDEYVNIYEYAGELGQKIEDLEYKVGVLWDMSRGRDPYNDEK